MKMIVVYKENVNPLYAFEEGTTEYWVEYPSKIELIGETLHEINLIHGHNWVICRVEQLIEISIKN